MLTEGFELPKKDKYWSLWVRFKTLENDLKYTATFTNTSDVSYTCRIGNREYVQKMLKPGDSFDVPEEHYFSFEHGYLDQGFVLSLGSKMEPYRGRVIGENTLILERNLEEGEEFIIEANWTGDAL